jgi:uncharacterized surface protein with fasciclin (FAS1) repeats
MAEVKVKITAQNEVQTGLQASLAEVRQFAGQAQKEMQSAFEPRRIQTERVAPTFGPIDIGDYGLEPLKKLQEEARKLRESAQAGFDDGPPEQFGKSVGGLVGRFALLIAGSAAVGKLLAAPFEKLSEIVKSSIAIQEQFNNALSQAGQATSFEGAISAFKQLNALADQTGKTLEQSMGRNLGEALANAVSGRPGQILARIGDLATGGVVSGDIQAQEEQQRRIAADTLRGNVALGAGEAEDIIGAGGDPEEIAKIQRQQEKQRELMALRATFAGTPGGEFGDEAKEAEKALKEQQALEDQIAVQKRLFEAKQQARAESEKTRQLGMSTEEKLEDEKITQSRLEGEKASTSSGASSVAEIEARVLEINAQIEQSKQRQISLEESLKREAERKAIVGVPVALDVTGLESIAQLESALSEIESKEIDVILNALGVDSVVEAKEAIKSLDESARTKIDQAREKQLTQEKERRSDFVQNTDLLQARASGDKEAEEAILRQQDLDKGLEATGSLEEATRFADAAAALREQQGAKGQSGSFGASSLQRIGFASNEFFDTRRSDDTATQIKSVGTVVKEIGQLLKKENVLLMKSEF